VDGVKRFKVCIDSTKIKNNADITYAVLQSEIGHENQLPLWLFGFIY
jgi:hypothetical protein